VSSPSPIPHAAHKDLAGPLDRGLPMPSVLQFAVVREDPRLEERLLDRVPGERKRVLAITSAGCTLLQLAARHDLAQIVGVDVNPRQSSWARLRFAAAKVLSRKDFCRATGISQVDPATREALLLKVTQSLSPEDRAFIKSERAFFAAGAFDEGNFERLFASWRFFVERFVAGRDDLQRFFEGHASVRDTIVSSPFWPIAFDLFFHQSLLLALFGPDATQHAPPGSYPRYFQARCEWALRQPDAAVNPYLSHILRGRYGALDQAGALPDYLEPARYERLASGLSRIQCITGKVEDALAAFPGPYEMIQLSNILDWSSEADSASLSGPVLSNLANGGFLLVRQLNNVRPLPRSWMEQLDFDPTLERELAASDRSFFYSSIRVGLKR
jgi:S-adenosylmethionine-diacylglycerol 3-amino-3-carboxypropyl transferase